MRTDSPSKALRRNRAGEARGGPHKSEEAIRLKSEIDGAGKSRWEQFRGVARELFGDKAFALDSDGPGKALRLSKSQLRELAAKPGRVQDAIKKLQRDGALPKNNNHFNAAKVAKLFSQSARDGLDNGRTFTVATINDDFTDGKTNLRNVNGAVNPDIMLFQEAKNSNLHKEAGKGMDTNQNLKSDALAGSAVLWDTNQVKAGKGGTVLGVNPPKGVGMLDRYMSFQDITVEGRQVRMISVHRPPMRFKGQWAAFDRNVAAFVKSSKLPVIIGLDANERTPQRLAKATGLRWESPGPKSIDGFLVSPEIGVANVRRLPKGNSDHAPVVADFHFKKQN